MSRERRMWALTGLTAATIYATMGLARTLSDELRTRALFDSLFAVAMLLVAASAVAFAWHRRATAAQWGVGLGVAAVYLLIFVRMGIPEERTHLIEYGVVALLAHEALRERGTRHDAIAAIVIAGVAGLGDELIQAVVPSRVYDTEDVIFNVLAAAIAIGARLLVEAAGRRASRGGASAS